MTSLEQLAPSAADPDIRAVLSANAANKAAGKQLLNELPLWQKMAARLRSLVLLMIIYSTFWPVAIGTAVMMYLIRLINSSQNNTHLNTKHNIYNLYSSSSRVDQQVQQPTADNIGASSRQQNVQSLPAPAAAAAAAEAPAGPGVKSPGTVLVTGGKMTKALHVCRHLHSSGWRVLLLETHKYWHVGSRFSTAVDAFYTVPVPEDEPAEYVQQIVDIAEKEGVTMFIPVSSPIASLYDALAAEALLAQARAHGRKCRCWTLSPRTTALLDNKASFSDYARSLGLLVPDHFVVTSPQQLMELNSGQALKSGKTFVLKNLSYDSVHRADLVKIPCPQDTLAAYVSRPDVIISEQQPWILQEFIKGKEYSCYSLADKGRLVAHSDTLAELSNLNFEHQGHPGIQQWVEQFVTRSNASGQLCFDFMEADGRLYCIECNPRTSSVMTEFHDNAALSTAFAAPDSVLKPVTPLRGSPAAYWWCNEVARVAMNPGYLPKFLHVVLNGVDAVFTADDPLPFLGLHYLQIPMLLLGNLVRGNPWKKVDLCIGKIAELYGD